MGGTVIRDSRVLIRINPIDSLQMINASLNKSVIVFQYHVEYSNEIYKWRKKAVLNMFSGAVV